MNYDIIAIGASTGGVGAVNKILSSLPAGLPPIMIVLHMPARFTKLFAESLHTLPTLCVKEAEHGDIPSFGQVFIAPGGKHMLLHKNAAGYCIELTEGDKVQFLRPSVDVLFKSVAKYAGSAAIGVILTGMGKDGAAGLLEMYRTGAYTIAQDEKSCVVYGMPKEAVALHAVTEVLSLDKISQAIISTVKSSR